MDTLFLYLFFFLALGTLEQLLFALPFVYAFNRRKRIWLRAVLFSLVSLAIMLGICFLCHHLLLTDDFASDAMRYGRIMFKVYAISFIIGLVFLFFHEKPSLFWYAIAGSIALSTVFSSVYDIFLNLTGFYSVYVFLWDDVSVYSVLTYVALLIALALGGWLLFGRPFAKMRASFQNALNVYMLIIFLLAIVFAVSLQNSVDVLIAGKENPSLKSIFDLFQILLCVIILIVERFALLWEKDARERIQTEVFYSNYKRQSEAVQRNMDAINIKCHDLKHQISAMLENEGVDAGFLKEVKESISIYDSSIKTGNDRLDVILSEKALIAETNGVQFTAMIDGSALSFLSISEINSFFGNALDNALEYLLRFEEKENRFIRLSSTAKSGFLTIRLENYCSHPPIIGKNGLPHTSKKDAANHGFGLKSMKSIVEKHGGVFLISIESDLYVLSAVFPLQV